MKGHIQPDNAEVVLKVEELGGTIGEWDWDVAHRFFEWVKDNIRGRTIRVSQIQRIGEKPWQEIYGSTHPRLLLTNGEIVKTK